MIERSLRWYASHGYGGLDLLYVPLLLTSAFAISQITDEQRNSFSTYRHMDDIAPFWAWELFCVVMVAGIVLGMLTRRRIVAQLSYVACAAFWLTLAWLIWSGSQTFLTPSWCVAFANGCLFRYAQIAYEVEHE